MIKFQDTGSQTDMQVLESIRVSAQRVENGIVDRSRSLSKGPEQGDAGDFGSRSILCSAFASGKCAWHAAEGSWTTYGKHRRDTQATTKPK